MKFDTNFLLSTLLLIISQKYYANLVEAGKVVNFLLEGEDGGQIVLMKATMQKKLQQSNDNEVKTDEKYNIDCKFFSVRSRL
jgi:hypothetical protein